MENQSSLTALMSLFGRVYHAENDEPIIFNDALSRQLMTKSEYEQIYRYMLGGIDFFAPDKRNSFKSDDEMIKWIVQTQIAPTPLARARFCEDSLKTAILTGTEQYVILGAGMDTFAFRNPDMLNSLHVFEVDHPLTQEEKKRRICCAGWQSPENLCFVPMDFRTDDLIQKLISHGFDTDKKTFFSWLGVSYYLTYEQIENVLKSISEISTEGSSLLFDYATENLFDSNVKRVQNMLAMAAASGEPMKSCFNFNSLERVLEKYRFLIYEHLCTEEIQKRFFENRTDYLSAFEHIEYALAVLK